jgi:hypothetical protein
MLAGRGLPDTELRVLPASPVHEQNDLSRLVIHVDDDLLDQSSHETLLGSAIGVGRVPCCLEICG